RQSNRWREEHGLDVPVSVNLSGRHLGSPDVVGHVVEVFTETGVDPAQICLEITEGTLLVDTAAVVQRLAAIRDLGVRISIAACLTGYASLAFLRTLPCDDIKTDRSFITALAEVPSAASIVASVVIFA